MKKLIDNSTKLITMVIIFTSIIKIYNPFSNNNFKIDFKGFENDLEEEIAKDLHLK